MHVFGGKETTIYNKREKSGSVCKDADNKPGAGFSGDQLQSDHLGVVAQFSGKLTSAIIFDSQEIVEHFNDLTYVNLMISKNQEKTLAVKACFEMWDATFVVNIYRYHAYNGIFAEQTFISAI